MAYGMSNTQVQMPDIVGGYMKGEQYGAQKAERERRQPIIEQLEKMKLQKADQAVKAGKQKMTLNDMMIAEQDRKRESAEMQDLGQAATWAMNQADPNAAFDQVLGHFEAEGKPTNQLKGRYDLMPMLRDLNNPDYAKQQAIQQNLMNLIQTLPKESQSQATMLGRASPQSLYKAVGEGMFSDGKTSDISTAVSTLPKVQQEEVISAYNLDEKTGLKLLSDRLKEKNKPKTAAETKQEKELELGLIDLEGSLQTFEALISDPGFAGAVGPIDAITGQIGAAIGTKEGVLHKKAVRATKRLIQDAASALKGSISDKDLELLEMGAPAPTDGVEVWKDWFENEYKPTIERARRKARLGVQSKDRGLNSDSKQALEWANANPSDPRSAQIKRKLGVN